MPHYSVLKIEVLALLLAFAGKGAHGATAFSVVLGREVIILKFSVLLDCPFPVLWLERTGFH